MQKASISKNINQLHTLNLNLRSELIANFSKISSTDTRTYLWTFKSAKPFSRSSLIWQRKYILILFIEENDLSTHAIDVGMIQKMLSNLWTFGDVQRSHSAKLCTAVFGKRLGTTLSLLAHHCSSSAITAESGLVRLEAYYLISSLRSLLGRFTIKGGSILLGPFSVTLSFVNQDSSDCIS